MQDHNDRLNYSPLYFLAALGAGGLAVSFFVYLQFMVPHAGSPLVTFDFLRDALVAGSPLARVLMLTAAAGVAVFAALHVILLAQNIRRYRAFRRTEGFIRLRSGNAEVSLMAIPLTLAMSINVGFAVGALFVPGLWGVVEYLFPVAVLAFLAVGIYALRIFGEYFSRLLINGDFDFTRNNNLSQLVAIFAFSMIAVGLAAPAAMSSNTAVAAAGMFFSIMFGVLALLLAIMKATLGLTSMLEHGISEEASPSLWIAIPILTLLGIAVIRVTHGLHHGFDFHLGKAGFFVLTSSILALQILIGLFGWAVMRRLGYFRDYLRGDKRHEGSYALVCPGVAFFVFGMFFLHLGLVKTGLVEAFSLPYVLLLLPLVLVQLRTIGVFSGLSLRLRSPVVA